MALASGGSSLSASITSLSSYSPPNVSDTSSLMGSTPSTTLVNVVTLFQGFFQSFGAMCAFFALLAWRAVINGHANRSQMGCVVQFVFGIMLINVLAIVMVGLSLAAPRESRAQASFRGGVTSYLALGFLINADQIPNEFRSLTRQPILGLPMTFLIAGAVCACAALAYAEVAAMIPASGSAYTYSYVALGEIIAWIVGWSLILEYSLVVSAVAVGWAGYAVGFLGAIGVHLPAAVSADSITASVPS